MFCYLGYDKYDTILIWLTFDWGFFISLFDVMNFEVNEVLNDFDGNLLKRFFQDEILK